MRKVAARGRRRFLAVAAALAAGSAIPGAPGAARAANTDNWKVGSSDWDTAANWSSGVVPGQADTVNIGVSNSATFTVTYDYTGAAVTINVVTVSMSAASGTA